MMSLNLDTENFPVSAKVLVSVILISSLIGYAAVSAIGSDNCKLMHEVVDPSTDYDVAEAYDYEELSDEAKHVFEESVADGGFWTEDQGLNSREFRYEDTITAYDITYQDETHKLLTYTEGC